MTQPSMTPSAIYQRERRRKINRWKKAMARRGFNWNWTAKDWLDQQHRDLHTFLPDERNLDDA